MHAAGPWRAAVGRCDVVRRDNPFMYIGSIKGLKNLIGWFYPIVRLQLNDQVSFF